MHSHKVNKPTTTVTECERLWSVCLVFCKNSAWYWLEAEQPSKGFTSLTNKEGYDMFPWELEISYKIFVRIVVVQTIAQTDS